MFLSDWKSGIWRLIQNPQNRKSIDMDELLNELCEQAEIIEIQQRIIKRQAALIAELQKL